MAFATVRPDSAASRPFSLFEGSFLAPHRTEHAEEPGKKAAGPTPSRDLAPLLHSKRYRPASAMQSASSGYVSASIRLSPLPGGVTPTMSTIARITDDSRVTAPSVAPSPEHDFVAADSDRTAATVLSSFRNPTGRSISSSQFRHEATGASGMQQDDGGETDASVWPERYREWLKMHADHFEAHQRRTRFLRKARRVVNQQEAAPNSEGDAASWPDGNPFAIDHRRDGSAVNLSRLDPRETSATSRRGRASLELVRRHGSAGSRYSGDASVTLGKRKDSVASAAGVSSQSSTAGGGSRTTTRGGLVGLSSGSPRGSVDSRPSSTTGPTRTLSLTARLRQWQRMDRLLAAAEVVPLAPLELDITDEEWLEASRDADVGASGEGVSQHPSVPPDLAVVAVRCTGNPSISPHMAAAGAPAWLANVGDPSVVSSSSSDGGAVTERDDDDGSDSDAVDKQEALAEARLGPLSLRATLRSRNAELDEHLRWCAMESDATTHCCRCEAKDRWRLQQAMGGLSAVLPRARASTASSNVAGRIQAHATAADGEARAGKVVRLLTSFELDRQPAASFALAVRRPSVGPRSREK